MAETDVLVVILNYRRRENVERIIAALREQTLRPRIAVWNNGVEGNFAGADNEFSSSENLLCLPRWHIAAVMGREYVTIIDDDLLPVRTDLLERCVAASRAHRDDRIIGYAGKKLGKDPQPYSKGRGATAKSGLRPIAWDNYVDIVKGRFMFLHVSMLARVPLTCPHFRGRGDDIWVSLKTARGPRHHCLPAFTHKAFEELDEGDSALFLDPMHLPLRDEMVRDMIRAGDVPWLSSPDQAVSSEDARSSDPPVAK